MGEAEGAGSPARASRNLNGMILGGLSVRPSRHPSFSILGNLDARVERLESHTHQKSEPGHARGRLRVTGPEGGRV